MSIKKFVQTAYQRFKQTIRNLRGRRIQRRIVGPTEKTSESGRRVDTTINVVGHTAAIRAIFKEDSVTKSSILRIKRLYPDVVLPTRAHPTDAGLDLVATSFNRHEKYDEYGTGLAIALPPGTVGLLFPRSSISNKDAMLSNSVGVIDAGFLGEVKLRFRRNVVLGETYKQGDKIAQLVVLTLPQFEMIEVDDFGEIKEGDRGINGFGSSGT